MTMILMPARRRSLVRRVVDALPGLIGLDAAPSRGPRFAPPVRIDRVRPAGGRLAEAFADPLL